jgi:hypothetical protein
LRKTPLESNCVFIFIVSYLENPLPIFRNLLAGICKNS